MFENNSVYKTVAYNSRKRKNDIEDNSVVQQNNKCKKTANVVYFDNINTMDHTTSEITSGIVTGSSNLKINLWDFETNKKRTELSESVKAINNEKHLIILKGEHLMVLNMTITSNLRNYF